MPRNEASTSASATSAACAAESPRSRNSATIAACTTSTSYRRIAHLPALTDELAQPGHALADQRRLDVAEGQADAVLACPRKREERQWHGNDVLLARASQHFRLSKRKRQFHREEKAAL